MNMFEFIACSVLVVMTQFSEASVVYHRWGRTTCPGGSFKIYSGFMASTKYDQVGGIANYLCLDSSPEKVAGIVPGWQYYPSALWGVEYNIPEGLKSDGKPMSLVNVGGKSLHDQNAPCVVCLVPNKSVQLMWPGRQDCGTSDMTMEYKGFVFGGHHGHASTNGVCVDEAPEAVIGGQANENEGLLDPVEVYCGTLPCPPYTHGDELPCAVCTI